MRSKRIDAIVAAVPRCRVAADIGCDHGYIGAALLRRGKAEKVVFADISAPSLEKARRLCEKEGLTDRAEFFVCDGTAGIRRADCVVIAGMGGKESIHILEECAFEPSFVVLQPMKNLPDVRKYVAGRYRIISDRIIKDGKFYNIIALEKGSDTLTEDEILFGRSNLKEPDDDFRQYIAAETAKTKKLLAENAACAAKAGYLGRLEAIAEELGL